MLRVAIMTELFDAVETLALTGEQNGDRLAILTNGGGAGVLATDALADAGRRLAELSAATITRLDTVCRRPGAAATLSISSAMLPERAMPPRSKLCSPMTESMRSWR